MIIPTPQFDPFFAEDGVPFREKMLQYIEQQFPELITQGILASNTDYVEFPEVNSASMIEENESSQQAA